METKLLGVGSKFPNFALACVDNKLESVTEQDLKGKWSVLFTWPFDFTFVCPTEVKSFNDMHGKFAALKCNLFGMSIDSTFVHAEWVSSMKLDLQFPMLSDVKRELSAELGILDIGTGATYRATYIIDPDLIIRSVTVNDLSVGRNSEETLRLVEAFQTGKLCGCNWQPGEKTLS